MVVALRVVAALIIGLVVRLIVALGVGGSIHACGPVPGVAVGTAGGVTVAGELRNALQAGLGADVVAHRADLWTVPQGAVGRRCRVAVVHGIRASAAAVATVLVATSAGITAAVASLKS